MQDSGFKWATIPTRQVRVKKRTDAIQKGLINFNSRNKLEAISKRLSPLPVSPFAGKRIKIRGKPDHPV
jgi:hypothetical protein